jgi:hypothetical protein
MLTVMLTQVFVVSLFHAYRLHQKNAAVRSSVLIIVAISAVAGLTVGVITAIFYGHRKRRRRENSVSSRSNSKRSNGSLLYNDIDDVDDEDEDEDYDDASNYSSDNSSGEGHGTAPQAVVHGVTSNDGSRRLSSSKTGQSLTGSSHGLDQSLHDADNSLHDSVFSMGSMPEAFVKGKRNGKTELPDSFVEGRRTERAASREALDDDDAYRRESTEPVPGPMVAGHRRTSFHNGEGHEVTESSRDSSGDEPPHSRRSSAKKTNGKKLTPNHRKPSSEDSQSNLNGRSDGLMEDMLSELGDSMTGDEAFSAQQKARHNWDKSTREDSVGILSMGDSEYSQ